MPRQKTLVMLAVAALTLGCDGKSGSSGGSRQGKASGVAVEFEADTAAAATEGYNSAAIGDGFGAGSGVAQRVPAPGPIDRRPAPMTGDASGTLRGVDVGSGNQGVDVASLPVDATAPMIVRTGTATIKVDSLAPAIARLRVMAQQLGGYVGTTSIQIGSEQLRSASVELKVPANRWNMLLDGIKPIGVLEHQEESADDVGEEFVDVAARVENARHLEARLVALLATRTGKLADALEVERELARVREEIERYEGRMRYLRSRSAISTMTIALHEPPPLVGGHPGDNPIADAFRTAWGLFVGAIAILISSLGVLVPLALLVTLAWWIRRLLGRRVAA